MGLTAQAPVEAEAVTAGYRGRAVVRDVSFALARGEILALLGPNGSGKTTLLKTLLGLIPAVSGAIRVEGAPLANLSHKALAGRLAYVPQSHGAIFPFLVRDMVLMGRAAAIGAVSAPGPADRAAAARALATIGIADLADRPYTELSGGQRQLVLIARALAQGAPTLIFDEPTASLDFGNQAKALEEMRTLARQGYAVLFTTHDPNHALAIADRALLIHDGKAVAEGHPQDILTTERLAEVYGVPIERGTGSGGRPILTVRLGP